MKHLPTMILLSLGMPQLILGSGCPDPNGLGPRTDDDKSMCAIMYNDAHNDPHTSCYGSERQVRNGEEEPAMDSYWNDRVSSLVVRAGCTLTGYQNWGFDGKRKEFIGMHYYLPHEHDHAVRFNWNDRLSSYMCHCWFSPVDCNPEDKWEELIDCNNTGDDNITCKYIESHGITMGKEFTNGHSISDTISMGVGAEIEGMFASASASFTTGYSWSKSTEFSTIMTEGVEVDVHVAAGSHKGIYQIQGVCGDSITKTTCFEVRDMNTKRVLDTTCPELYK